METGGVMGAVSRIQGAFSALSSDAGRMGARFGTLGTAAGVAVGSVAVAIGAAAAASVVATKAAMDWEVAMAGVAKTTGELKGTEGYDQISDALLDISTRAPVAREELASIAQIAGTLGISGADNIAAFTETISQASVAFEMGAGDAASTLAQIANAYDRPITETQNFASAINELGNNFATNEANIMNFVSRATKFTKTFDESIENTAAFGAVLEATGIPAERLATGIDAVTRASADPKKATKWAELMGVSVEELNKMLSEDLYATIIQTADAINELPTEIERSTATTKIFGEEAKEALSKATGQQENYKKAIEMSNDASREGTALLEEYSAMSDTSASKFTQISNTIGAIAIDFGDVINSSETFQGVLDGTLTTLHNFRDSIPEIIDSFETMAGFLSHAKDDVWEIAEGFGDAVLAATGLGLVFDKLGSSGIADKLTEAASGAGSIVSDWYHEYAGETKVGEDYFNLSELAGKHLEGDKLTAEEYNALHEKGNLYGQLTGEAWQEKLSELIAEGADETAAAVDENLEQSTEVAADKGAEGGKAYGTEWLEAAKKYMSGFELGNVTGEGAVRWDKLTTQADDYIMDSEGNLIRKKSLGKTNIEGERVEWNMPYEQRTGARVTGYDASTLIRESVSQQYYEDLKEYDSTIANADESYYQKFLDWYEERGSKSNKWWSDNLEDAYDVYKAGNVGYTQTFREFKEGLERGRPETSEYSVKEYGEKITFELDDIEYRAYNLQDIIDQINNVTGDMPSALGLTSDVISSNSMLLEKYGGDLQTIADTYNLTAGEIEAAKESWLEAPSVEWEGSQMQEWVKSLPIELQNASDEIKEALYSIYEADPSETFDGLSGRLSDLVGSGDEISLGIAENITGAWDNILSALSEPELSADEFSDLGTQLDFLMDQALEGVTDPERISDIIVYFDTIRDELKSKLEQLNPYELYDTTQNMADYWAEHADIVEVGGDELLLKLYNLESKLASADIWGAGGEGAWSRILDPESTDQQFAAAIALLNLDESERELVQKLREVITTATDEALKDLVIDSAKYTEHLKELAQGGLDGMREVYEETGTVSQDWIDSQIDIFKDLNDLTMVALLTDFKEDEVLWDDVIAAHEERGYEFGERILGAMEDIIVDKGKYLESLLGDIGTAAGTALKDNIVKVQEQEAISELIKTYEDAGGDMTDALIVALKAGDYKEVGRLIGTEVTEGFEDSIGGIGEVLTAEFNEAVSSLQGAGIWEKLMSDDPEQVATAKKWIAQYTDPSTWYSSKLRDTASEWRQLSEDGIKVQASFWDQMQTQWNTNSEWFDAEMGMYMGALERHYGSISNIANLSYSEQVGILELLANGIDGLSDDLDKSTKKIKDQKIGLAHLTAEGWNCTEAMSAFGQAQEANADKLFFTSAVGVTDEEYAKILAADEARGAIHPGIQALGSTTQEFDYSMVEEAKLKLNEIDSKLESISGKNTDWLAAAGATADSMAQIDETITSVNVKMSEETIFNPDPSIENLSLVADEATAVVTQIETSDPTMGVYGNFDDVYYNLAQAVATINNTWAYVNVGLSWNFGDIAGTVTHIINSEISKIYSML